MAAAMNRLAALVLVLGTLFGVLGLSDAAKVLQAAACSSYSLAVMDDHTVRGWGNWGANMTATPLQNLTNVEYICCGYAYAAGTYMGGMPFYLDWQKGTVVPFPGVTGPVLSISCAFGQIAVLINNTTVYVENPEGRGVKSVDPSSAVVAAGYYGRVFVITTPNGTVKSLNDSAEVLSKYAPPAGLRDVTQLAVGGAAAALLRNRTLVIWATDDPRFTVPSALQGNCAEVGMGPSFVVALDRNGRLYEWGDPGYAKNKPADTIPFPSNLTGKAKSISVGPNHVVAVMEDGTIAGWGWKVEAAVVPADLAYVDPASRTTTTTATSTTTKTSTATATATQTAIPENPTPVGAIAGGVVGGVAAIALLAAGFLVYRRKQKQPANTEAPAVVENKAIMPPATHPYYHQSAPATEPSYYQNMAYPAPINKPEPPPQPGAYLPAVPNEPEEKKPTEVPKELESLVGRMCFVIEPFDPEFEDELSLAVGESVKVLSARSGGFSRPLAD